MKWMFKEDHSVGERGAAGRRVQVKPAFCACLRGRERRGRGGSNVRRTRPCTGRPALCELNVSRQRGRGFSARTPRPVPFPPAAAGASIGPLEPPSGRRLFFFICVDVSVFLSLPETRASVPGGQCAGPRAAFSAHPLCQSIDYCFTLK